MTAINERRANEEADGHQPDQKRSFFHDLDVDEDSDLEPSHIGDDSDQEEAKQPPQRNFENQEDI